MIVSRNSICPRILQKLEASKKDAMNCIVYIRGHSTIEISHCVDGNKVVNLTQRTCMYEVADDRDSMCPCRGSNI